jgi:hypothetical protein
MGKKRLDQAISSDRPGMDGRGEIAEFLQKLNRLERTGAGAESGGIPRWCSTISFVVGKLLPSL